MVGEKNNKDRVREIVSLLPKENCGKCGFSNCGGFAIAVVEGEASPYGCRKDPSAGYAISKALGIETAVMVAGPLVRSESYRHSLHQAVHQGFGHRGHRLGHNHAGRRHHHSRRHHLHILNH